MLAAIRNIISYKEIASHMDSLLTPKVLEVCAGARGNLDVYQSHRTCPNVAEDDVCDRLKTLLVEKFS